jgi:hypothetical protein
MFSPGQILEDNIRPADLLPKVFRLKELKQQAAASQPQGAA